MMKCGDTKCAVVHISSINKYMYIVHIIPYHLSISMSRYVHNFIATLIYEKQVDSAGATQTLLIMIS